MPTVGIYNETGQHGNYDQTEPVWPASTAISPGDLIYRDTVAGTDKPMSSYTWNTNIATTSGTANAVFRGVSMARRLATQTTAGGKADGNIICTGEFTFPCDALGAAAVPGAYVSFAPNAGSTALENQKVRITATIGEAIGFVTRDAAVGATYLTFKLHVPMYQGGPVAPA